MKSYKLGYDYINWVTYSLAIWVSGFHYGNSLVYFDFPVLLENSGKNSVLASGPCGHLTMVCHDSIREAIRGHSLVDFVNKYFKVII